MRKYFGTDQGFAGFGGVARARYLQYERPACILNLIEGRSRHCVKTWVTNRVRFKSEIGDPTENLFSRATDSVAAADSRHYDLW
jgi:hypothetical protein